MINWRSLFVRTHPAHLHPIDGLRVIASFAVVQGHALVLQSIFMPLQPFIDTVLGSTILDNFIRIPTGWGVQVFFLISGFLLMHNMVRESLAAAAASAPQPSLLRRFALRAVRLFPLIFALSYNFYAVSTPNEQAAAWRTWLGLVNYNVWFLAPEAFGMFFGVTWSVAADWQASLLLTPLFAWMLRPRPSKSGEASAKPESRLPAVWPLVALCVLLAAVRAVITFTVMPEHLDCPVHMMPHIALFVPPPADASPFVVACVKETGLKLKHLYWPTHARLLEFVAGAATALALARRELRVKQQRAAASQEGDNGAKLAQGSLFGELRFSLLFALLAMQFTCLVPLLGNYPDHASSLVRRVSLALNRPVFALLFCCTLYELLRPDLALRSARLVARVLSWRALYPLSQLSFGVYLCHMLVCGWLLIPPGAAALNLTFEQLQARPWLTLAYGCVVYAVANLCAAVLHLFVERPAIALGSRLLRGPAAASAATPAAGGAPGKDKAQ